MKVLLVTLLCVGPLTLLAQKNKYDISVSYGFYGAPEFERQGRERIIFVERAQSKGFFAAEFEYHLTNHWAISTGFLEGSFAYFDNIRTGIFPIPSAGPKATNGKGYESHLYLKAFYSIVNKNNICVQAGTGLGMYNRTLKFPFAWPSSSGGPYGESIFISETSIRKLELPLMIDVYYLMRNRIGLGVKAGTFLISDGSLVSPYIGPQLRIRL